MILCTWEFPRTVPVRHRAVEAAVVAVVGARARRAVAAAVAARAWILQRHWAVLLTLAARARGLGRMLLRHLLRVSGTLGVR